MFDISRLPGKLQLAILIALLIPPILGLGVLVWVSITTGMWIILLPAAVAAGWLQWGSRTKSPRLSDPSRERYERGE